MRHDPAVGSTPSGPSRFARIASRIDVAEVVSRPAVNVPEPTSSATASTTAWCSSPRRCRASGRRRSPCSCPPARRIEPEERGGTASMLAEWITRGAGDLDSRELLGARQPGRLPLRGGADRPHERSRPPRSAATSIPALGLFADVVRRPQLDDDEVEPIRRPGAPEPPGPRGRPRHEGRSTSSAAATTPTPGAGPRLGTLEGVAAATPDDLRAFHEPTYRPNGAILAVAGAIDWAELREAVGRLFGDWEPRPEPTVQVRPAGPEPRPHPQGDAADPDRAGLSERDDPPPRLLPRPRRDGDPRRLLVGPALHRGPREAGALLHGLRQLREPQGPRRRRSATPGPRPTGPRRRSTSPSPRSPAWPTRASRPRSSRRCGRA